MSIVKGAEPFYFPGNEIACLLIHGFTSSPREMRFLGQELSDHGFTVLGIRLFAHATHYKDMPRARWQDWVANIEDGWHLLDGDKRPIVLIGFSLGASLALYFGSRFPVKAIVAIAAPHHFPEDPRSLFLQPLTFINPYIYSKKIPVWFDQSKRADHIRYPNDSTRALIEVRNFLHEMKSALPNVKSPTLLIYSKNDPTIQFKEHQMENIFASINSPIKETILLEKSGHIIPLDSERDRVYQACIQFINRVVK